MAIERNEPWLVSDAIEFLNGYLTKDMRVLEFGSGASTVWIAQRVAEVISIENDRVFAPEVQQMIDDSQLDNVFHVYKHIPTVGIVKYLPDEYFDFILVDNEENKDGKEARIYLATAALPKLKEGGVMMLDNSERQVYASIIELFDRHIGNKIEAEQTSPDKFGFWYKGWKTTWWSKCNVMSG